jgi:signal peptidase I
MTESGKVQREWSALPGNGSGRSTTQMARDPRKLPHLLRSRRHLRALRVWTVAVIIAVIAVCSTAIFVARTFVVISPSMERSLLVGDYVIIDRAAMGARIPFTNTRLPGYSSPRRGDVIVFRPPAASLTRMDLVKRVIGMPGDTIEMRDRRVYLDGQRFAEPYARQTPQGDVSDEAMAWQVEHVVPSVDPRGYAPTRDSWGPLIVPPHSYFVMGDNREGSIDSRYWGFVDVNQIEGRVVFVYFSYGGLFPVSSWNRRIRWDRIGRAVR